MNIVQFFLNLIVPLIVLAVLLWVFEQILGVASKYMSPELLPIIRVVIRCVVVLAVLFWILGTFGFVGHIFGPITIR